jgi:hypothetical protein
MLAIRSVIEILIVAQAVNATIGGTVRDESTGQPLTGVVVALPDLSRVTVTSDEGTWLLRDVPAGPHHLSVEGIGYSSRTLHALVPRSGHLAIDITLRPDPVVLPRVDVRRAGKEQMREGAPGERVVDAATTGMNPLLAEPDVLLALGGGFVVAHPETPTGLHVRGGAADQTSWLLDGIPVFNPYHAAGVFSAWNPDALSVVDLHSAVPSASEPHSLSGTVAASVRTAGPRSAARGGLSTTQASMTADGPLGGGEWLISARTAFPDRFAPTEASYLRGSTSDWLGRAEAHIAGGALSIIGYANDNAFSAAARTQPVDTEASETHERNEFEWRSRSYGGTWMRQAGRARLRLRAWSASSDADARWLFASDSFGDLVSTRHDAAVSTSLELSGTWSTTAGLRFESSRTSYRVTSGDTIRPSFDLDVTTPVLSAFLERTGPVGDQVHVEAGSTVAFVAGGVYASPRARLTWQPASTVSLSGSWSKLHQFAQSLRNAESVVGILFPVDLYVGAAADGVPVASSDVGVVAAELRPSAGIRLGLQGWLRTFNGLLFVAPVDGEPFSTGGMTTGAGSARGLSVDGGVRGARFDLIASWGWRRVRFETGGAMWVPEHGTEHDVSAGITAFPGSTTSVRIGAHGRFGRRTTPVPDALEWESCNLADSGCEFAGSPHYGTGEPGAARLPAYLRFDIAARKHWHLAVFGRDAILALSGTLTNVLGRQNVLTWAGDPAGAVTAIEMRPRSPLVLGVDWQF